MVGKGDFLMLEQHLRDERREHEELQARIRELEAENAMNLEAAQALEVERHRERERAQKAEAENARLREAGDRMALLLSRAGTSPSVTIGEEAEWARSAMESWHAAKRGTHG